MATQKTLSIQRFLGDAALQDVTVPQDNSEQGFGFWLQSAFASLPLVGEGYARIKGIHANQQIEARRQALRVKELELQYLMNRERIDAQSEENALNRAAQKELAEFRADFDTRQQDRQFDFQRECLERTQQLQIELRKGDAELARELRAYDRETQKQELELQKQLRDSPICLVPSELLNPKAMQDAPPLRVFFSPPTVLHDEKGAKSAAEEFPRMNDFLATELRKALFDHYNAQGRQIDFIDGAWTSKFFHGAAAISRLFNVLKSEPTLILEAAVEEDLFNLHVGYWGMSWPTYQYKSLIAGMSWQEMLYDIAKQRACDTLLGGKLSEQDILDLFGESGVAQFRHNLAIAERERKAKQAGIDPRSIARRYILDEHDRKALRRLLAACHCVCAGCMADQYFLLEWPADKRQRPLLPDLLAELTNGLPPQFANYLLEFAMTQYRGMYAEIERREPLNAPDLRLDFVESLLRLPEKRQAVAQVLASLQAWLRVRRLPQPETLADALAAADDALTPADGAYVERLTRCLQQAGLSCALNVAQACFRRGERLAANGDHAAAVVEFSQAIQTDSSYADAYYARGNATLDQSDDKMPAQALADYLDALHLNPTHPYARMLRVFWFDVVTVNANGESVKRETRTARQKVFDLGNGVTLDMVYIPGGTFWMGSRDGEGEKYEHPRHQVTVAPFFIGKYPVTQAQWQAVMGNNPSRFEGADRPVEWVSWNDAQKFLQKLNTVAASPVETHGRASLQFRLPSEAEWEYACRAGTETAYSFGDDPAQLGSYAWFKGNSGSETHPVGQKQPNAWGLCDMYGNVWEWCADTWHDNYNGAPNDGSAWTGEGDGRHILRGGSWWDSIKQLRCAFRLWDCGPVNWVNLLGFRVVLVGSGLRSVSPFWILEF